MGSNSLGWNLTPPVVILDLSRSESAEAAVHLRNTLENVAAFGLVVEASIESAASSSSASTTQSILSTAAGSKRLVGDFNSLDTPVAGKRVNGALDPRSEQLQESAPRGGSHATAQGSRPSILQRLGPSISESFSERDAYGCIPGVDPPPPQGKKSFCYNFLYGRCFWPVCDFNHYSAVELKAIHCPQFTEFGSCKYGSECVYRHS